MLSNEFNRLKNNQSLFGHWTFGSKIESVLLGFCILNQIYIVFYWSQFLTRIGQLIVVQLTGHIFMIMKIYFAMMIHCISSFMTYESNK